MVVLWRAAGARRVVCESVWLPLVGLALPTLGMLLAALLFSPGMQRSRARPLGWALVAPLAAPLLVRRRLEFDRVRRHLRQSWSLGLGPRLPALALRTIADAPLVDFDQVAVIRGFDERRRIARRVPVFTVVVSRRAAERLGGFFAATPIEVVARPDATGARRDAARLAADLGLPWVDRSQ
jgi:hypothetical protein